MTVNDEAIRRTSISHEAQIVRQLERIADALEKLAEPPPETIALLPDPCGAQKTIFDGTPVTCGLPPNHRGRHKAEQKDGTAWAWTTDMYGNP
jgi:hypothetical protein